MSHRIIRVFFSTFKTGKHIWVETWCEVSPKYTTVKIREGKPGQIVCAIPDLPGSSVEVVNQLGNVVHIRREVSKYVSFKQALPSIDNVTHYQLNITWTQDEIVREQLKVLQCVANFQGRTNPCRTSIVMIDFEEGSKPGTFRNFPNRLLDISNCITIRGIIQN